VTRLPALALLSRGDDGSRELFPPSLG
jgi:hypothetical protein